MYTEKVNRACMIYFKGGIIYDDVKSFVEELISI